MAYLRRETLDRAAKETEASSPEALVSRYIDLLPEHHVEGSCFYHGSQGCTLPRAMRSDRCNAFSCFALRNAIAGFGGLDEGADVLLVSEDAGTPQRAATFGPEGLHPADPGPLVDRPD